METQRTDRHLIERARCLDDDTAWNYVLKTFGGAMLRVARSEGLSESDAEDVRQNVLLRLLRVLPKFRYSTAIGRFRSYLSVSVRREARRSRCRNRPEPLEPAVLDAKISRDARPLVQHGSDATGLGRLGPAIASVARTSHGRSLAVLRLWLTGESTADSARALGMSVAAVQKARQRIRVRLLVELEREARREA